MGRKIAITLFFVLMCSGAATYVVIRTGVYPVAIVNSEMISARLFERELGVALNYYTDTLRGNEITPPPGQDFIRELRRAVLDDLIEKRLIRQLAREAIGENLPALVNEKIGFLDEGDENIPATIESLYGMSLEEFRELVMIPEAERVILKNELFADEKDRVFAEYLEGQRNEAKVYVFSDLLAWRGGKIEHK